MRSRSRLDHIVSPSRYGVRSRIVGTRIPAVAPCAGSASAATIGYGRGVSRPLRIPVAGGIYHVTARGNHRETIYVDEIDRHYWVEVLGHTCSRANWRVHAWCQMGNHYHLVVETPEPNISEGMRRLNGVYTQRINRRYDRTGHLFQGRFHAVLIERQTHLLELARYVVLNPVRANLVQATEEWNWSSYRATIGKASAPSWLETRWTHSQLGLETSSAIAQYIRFVKAGTDAMDLTPDLQLKAILGRSDFMATARRKGLELASATDLTEIKPAHCRAQALSLKEYQLRVADPREAMAQAYSSGGYSMREIAIHFGVHRTTGCKRGAAIRVDASD